MDNYISILDQQCNELLEDFDKGVVYEKPNNKSLRERHKSFAKRPGALNLTEHYELEFAAPTVEVVEEVKEVVPTYTRPTTVQIAESLITKQVEFENKKNEDKIVIKNDDLVEQTLYKLQRQINEVSSSVSGLREATLVSGIGQGGDGQTPGSGVVFLSELDDVNIDGISNGDSIIWNENLGGFVPGAGGSGGGGSTINLVAGTGIDITDDGAGTTTISLAAATSQLSLVDPVDTGFRYSGSTIPVELLTTQEDANKYFAQAIDDIDGRVTSIETGGTQSQLDDLKDLVDELVQRIEAFENGTNFAATAPITTISSNSVTTTGFDMTDLSAPPP